MIMQTNGRIMQDLNEFKEFLRDKRVILVGNNLTALERKQKNVIDSYDVVIRLGKGIIQGWEEYIGYKTDVWATGSFRSSMRSLLDDDVITLYNVGGTHNNKNKPNFPFIQMHSWEEVCDLSTKYTGDWEYCRLSNGAVTAHWLYHNVGTFKQLDFINFDFFQVSCKFFDTHNKCEQLTNSWHLPLTPPAVMHKGTEFNSSHDPDAEKAVFKEILADPRCNIINYKISIIKSRQNVIVIY